MAAVGSARVGAGRSEYLITDGRSHLNERQSPTLITPDLLRDWPLPRPDEEGDKEERGRVLVVGGGAEVPGGAILAAVAALRAGAGKLRIATAAGVRAWLAAAIPEARVFALPERPDGEIAASAAVAAARQANEVDAALIGPGLVDDREAARLIGALLPLIERPVAVLDAVAISGLRGCEEDVRSLAGRVILTPHAGEMAALLGVDRDAVRREPLEAAKRAARAFRAVVALKGATTCIAAPDGAAFCNRAGNVGLATSGSGDTLAGLIAGLAARGASPLQAAVWAVFLHAAAGDRLAARMGELGFLARKLLAEVPILMDELARGRGRG